MKQISFYLLLFILTFSSCDDSIDKSLISETEKLGSPNGKFTLYKYFIESSMAFGSGFSVIKVLDSKDKCDFTDRDFFTLHNDSPFFIEWKNDDTLLIKCIIDGGELSDKQPIKQDIKKWKDWVFEVEYYTIYSASAEIKYSFDDYSIDNNFIRFKSKDDSLVLKKDEVQISLDTNHIYLTQFKIDTFKSKLGISFSHYDLSLKKGYKQEDFLRQQAFLRLNN
jgi:hypothetical protein